MLRFNSRFGEIFPLPERITPELGARVMSLQNPQAKMSKSDPDPTSRVNLLDEPDVIRKKIKASVTDSDRTVRYDWDEKPGSVQSPGTLRLQHRSQPRRARGGVSRTPATESSRKPWPRRWWNKLTPIRTRFKAMDDGEVARIMQKGALDARARAEGTMVAVRRAVGLAG